MGDSGSLFIGAVLASASLVPVFNTGIAFVSPAVLVVFILIVPLFDTGFVLVLRRLAGRKASKGGTDHVSHRLASLGFSERSAVRILYALGLAGGAVAWELTTGPGIEPMALVAVFGVLLILFGIFLARVPAYNAQDFIALQKSSFAPLLKDLAFRWHAAEVLLDLVLITVCYYGAYRIRFEGQDFDNWAPYFAASLPVVLGCRLPALYASGLYQRAWNTFGLRDLAAVVRGVGMGSLLIVAVASFESPVCETISAACWCIDFILLIAGHHDHARIVPGDGPGGCHPQQAQPAGAGLRRRRIRAAARARDAHEPALEHEPDRLHRRRPGEGAPLDCRRAGARHHRRPGRRGQPPRCRGSGAQQPVDQRQRRGADPRGVHGHGAHGPPVPHGDR